MASLDSSGLLDQERPEFSHDEVRQALASAYDLQASKIDDLGSFVDQNFRVTDQHGDRWTVKIHDPREREPVIDMQDAAIAFLQDNEFGPQVPSLRKTTSGDTHYEIRSSTGGTFPMRVLKYIDGPLLADAKVLSKPFLGELGKMIGTMDHMLREFDHPAVARPDMVWDLVNAPLAEPLTADIANHETRRLARYYLLQFVQTAEPILRQLPKSVVHNDCHRYSVIADEVGAPKQVAGVIDFGDSVLSHPICHLAVVLSDILVAQDHLIETAQAVVAGYHSANPLSEAEIGILLTLVGTRLAMYAARSSHAARQDSENAHAQIKSRAVSGLMTRLIAINPVAWEDAMLTACGYRSILEGAENEVAAQQHSRDDHLPKSLYTHYDEPLSLIGSAFQYFYDRRGRTYVDFVNNVSQSGHCHPVIVNAISRQAATLNTNSRYLYDGLGSYAERLASYFPDPLNYVFLVNSGSEANDLALRLARAFTGGSDSIVIDTAYHGNSSATTDISPQRVDRPGGPGLPNSVRKIMAPDRYRGPFGYDDPEAGRKYGEMVHDAIALIERGGRKVSSFVAESMIGTGGQVILPDGYLATVYEAVRAAGGLTIADEVQMGFGRIGTHMWCWETQNVVPDIVTMGKPMANGHPMAAVVTRREIAAAFDDSIVYFNTFGGNPVSCAAANAVLDVLEKEELRANVVAMSRRIMAGLHSIAQDCPLIGDIRGLGLYIGVELVLDPESKSPATKPAKQVVAGMKNRGFLTNINGASGNIVKIKPPLLIPASDIDAFLEAFRETLNQVQAGMETSH